MRRTLLLISLPAFASIFGPPVDVRITPAIREYCHVIRFPQGWIAPLPLRQGSFPPSYGYDSLYEFRVPGVLETTFLVAGVVLPSKQYTLNKYKVDLSDPKSLARPITDAEWEDGTPLPDLRMSDLKRFANVHLTGNQPLTFQGFQLAKSGDIWPGRYASLSPDQAWFVLLSSSGEVAKRDDNFLGLTLGGSSMSSTLIQGRS